MALLRKSTRVYLDVNREGTITCIACGVTRSINMSKYGDDIGGKTLNAQCRACAAVFRATFDFPRHCRVHLHLPGRLLQLRTREEVEPSVVTSLSVAGVGFVTAPGVSVGVGDKYEVVFVLDDEDQSVLFEEIVITRVRGTRVGAAFSSSHYANHDLIFLVVSL